MDRQSHSVTHTTLCFIKYQPGAGGARVKGSVEFDRAIGRPSDRAAVPRPAAELGEPTRAARADAAERDRAEVPGQDPDVGRTARPGGGAGRRAEPPGCRLRRPRHDPDAQSHRVRRIGAGHQHARRHRRAAELPADRGRNRLPGPGLRSAGDHHRIGARPGGNRRARHRVDARHHRGRRRFDRRHRARLRRPRQRDRGVAPTRRHPERLAGADHVHLAPPAAPRAPCSPTPT